MSLLPTHLLNVVNSYNLNNDFSLKLLGLSADVS
jgi:hypothetical protein